MKQEKRIVKKGKEGRALPRGGSEEKNYGNEAWIENNTELSKEKKEKVLTIEKKESIWMERKRERGGDCSDKKGAEKEWENYQEEKEIVINKSERGK